VFERYFRGSDEIQGRRMGNVTFDADTLHDMKSVSKSVASLALGIAIDRGLIGSVSEPIFSFFPELSDLRSREKERLQLSHVLTMSMGLKWVEATPSTGDYDNDEARMHMALDPCRYVLGLPATAPPGEEFFYNTGALTLLSAVVRKATGRPLDEFRARRCLSPWASPACSGTASRGIPTPEGDCACGHAIWRKLASLSWRAAAGMTARSFRGHGSTPRSHRGSTPRATSPMDISGGSAARSSMAMRSAGLPRLVVAGSRFASSRSSISLSW
jgi:CubicO group peptidase (beta-lactamase class C family)